jgi:hypothetical protein
MNASKQYNERNKMNIKQAREYFEMGVIAGFEVVRSPMSESWLLQVVGRAGKSWILQTALKQDKAFSSLDTLISEIEGITGRVNGFTVRI